MTFATARSNEEHKSMKCSDGHRKDCQVLLNVSSAVCGDEKFGGTSKFHP